MRLSAHNQAGPQTGRPHTLSAPSLPRHLVSYPEDPSPQALFPIKKVVRFVEWPIGKKFSQTSTLFQWHKLEEFEVCRHLGYLMAWAYFSTSEV
jgi:hypothetical protein